MTSAVLKERILRRISVFAGMMPEDDESWSSWYSAAFNMLADEIDRMSPVTADRPVVTTLCGSSRFPDAFALANMHLSMLGRVVIGLACFGHADQPVGARHLTSDGDETTPEKQHLDQLHFRKIDISDGIFVVNPGGYVGSSTKREIAYAQSLGKTVEWLFPPEAA